MTRNLKPLGLVVFAAYALCALGAQGASATQAQFKFDGQRAILTGGNASWNHNFTIGAAGAIQCYFANFESTVDAGEGQTEVDELTVTPSYSTCSFDETAVTVFVNDCAYVFDSDTTKGSSTGNEHAAMAIECAPGNKIELHTATCTLTIGPQTLADAVTHATVSASEIVTNITAHAIVVGKARTTAAQPVNGCLMFPTGAIARLVSSGVTSKCFRDENQSAQSNPTTPSGTEEGTTTECEFVL